MSDEDTPEDTSTSSPEEEAWADRRGEDPPPFEPDRDLITYIERGRRPEETKESDKTPRRN